MNKIKQHPFLLFSSIVSLVFGVWFILDSPAKLIGFIYGFVGVVLILIGVSKILLNNPIYTYDGLLNLLTGVIIIIFHDLIITIILGAIFLVFPLVRLLKSKNKKHQFKMELPYLLFGLVIVLCGNIFAFILVKIIGVLFLALALCFFIAIFKVKTINFTGFNFYRNDSNNSIDFDDFIDVEFEEVSEDE